MRKRFLAAALAVLLLSGCSDGTAEIETDTSTTTAAATTTTARVSIVEDQPENTIAVGT